MEAFEQWLRGGTAVAGLEIDDVEVEIARFADSLYGPGMRALAGADLGEVMPEFGLDPGRPPAQ